MREEADGAVAVGAVLAQLGAVAGGVQPALKHAMGVWARVPSDAEPLLVVRARDGAVPELPRVAPARVFCGVRKGARPPVVCKTLVAPRHLHARGRSTRKTCVRQVSCCRVGWGCGVMRGRLEGRGGEAHA